MLEDEKTILLEEVALEDEPYYLVATLKIVWRIREYYVELLGTALQVEEGISLHSVEVLEAELAGSVAYEVMVYAIYLYRCDATRIA